MVLPAQVRCPMVAALAAVWLLVQGAGAQCTMAWSPIGGGTTARVTALVALPDGSLVAGGEFVTFGGVAANRVARWDGASWSPMGAGLNGAVATLCVCSDGSLLAGGQFTMTGTAAANHVARWDGASWMPLGAGTNGPVNALLQLPGGDIVAAGFFSSAGGLPISNVARWNGSGWSAFGNGPGSGVVKSLTTLPNGDLVIGGLLAIGGSIGIARWDGTAWSGIGGGMTGGGFTSVHAMVTLPNGDLVAAGAFTAAGGVPANNIARWNGSAWLPLGPGQNGPPQALALLPDGDLVAGGFATPQLARWDGTHWTSIANSIDNTVYALLAGVDGALIAAGDFTSIDGLATSRVARRTTSCPASGVAYGAGCLGPAGPTALAATQLPWLGGVLRAKATGMTPGALAVGAFAFQQLAMPMPLVHPLGVVGCALLVQDDILIQFATTDTGVTTSLAIPDAPSLIGGSFYHQVVIVELDVAGSIMALTSTNGLALTIGAL